MSGSRQLVDVLKAELRSAGLTYADLARELHIAESSVKRIFAKADMPLSRIDEVLRVLKMDFTDLARKLVETAPAKHELTLAQEKALVADRQLLLVAICCLSQWSAAQVTTFYTLGEADCVRCLTHLDRLGFIELRAQNRYRLKVGQAFRWRPDGPVMAYFREQVVPDYFDGRFDGEGELLTLVHGHISPAHSVLFNERLHRLTHDFSQHHQSDQALPLGQKRAYTLVIGMRSWEFVAFRDLQRPSKVFK